MFFPEFDHESQSVSEKNTNTTVTNTTITNTTITNTTVSYEYEPLDKFIKTVEKKNIQAIIDEFKKLKGSVWDNKHDIYHADFIKAQKFIRHVSDIESQLYGSLTSVQREIPVPSIKDMLSKLFLALGYNVTINGEIITVSL